MFLVGNDFQWNGTIVAPNAEVVVGQSCKNFYGAIYAKSIVIQNTRIIWVPFVQTQGNVVAKADFPDLNYVVDFWRI